MEKKRMLILILALIGVVGAFLPWNSMPGGMPFPRDLRWGSWLSMVFFAVGGWMVLAKGNRSKPLDRQSLQIVWGTAAAAFLFGLIKLISIPDGCSSSIGLWLMILAGLAQVAVALFYDGAVKWDLPDRVKDPAGQGGADLEPTPPPEPEDLE